MKAITTAVIVATSAVPALASDQTYDFKNFSNIEVSAGVQLDVTTGESYLISAEVLEGKLKNLEIEKDGDTLIISRKQGWGLWDWVGEDRFRVTVNMPMLKAIQATSGSAANVEFDQSNNNLVAKASSGASMSLNGLDAYDVRLTASSGASLFAAGNCTTLSSTASSGASIVAGDLQCDLVALDGSSGASIKAHSTDEADVEASSGASITLAGAGKIGQIDLSSGGAFRRN